MPLDLTELERLQERAEKLAVAPNPAEHDAIEQAFFDLMERWRLGTDEERDAARQLMLQCREQAIEAGTLVIDQTFT